MSRSKEELAEEVYNMSDEELNDFAFFALKVMDKRCDQYENIIYCMAEYICSKDDTKTSIKDIISQFIEIASSHKFEFDRRDIFNEVINK